VKAGRKETHRKWKDNSRIDLLEIEGSVMDICQIPLEGSCECGKMFGNS
jgi:hypothetical protein